MDYVPSESDFEPRTQDTVRAWFRWVGAYCAVFGAFWHLFGLFLGHIVEWALEGSLTP